MATRLVVTLFASIFVAVQLPTSNFAEEVEQANAVSSASPCAQGQFREFDFWVGKWNVKDSEGKALGVNTISNEENGCAIVEHWSSARGGTGQSVNYYDPAAKRWKQLWVGYGLIWNAEGGFSDGRMQLEGPLQYLGQDRATMLRGTWTPLSDGRIRHLFEESDDGGKSWTSWFDGYYSRE